MTRFLSDSLQAREPFFRLGLADLSGHDKSADIRFTTKVRQQTRAKMRELGLDPDDTTPEELYHHLQERLRADDAKLVKRLRTAAATHVSAEGDVVSGMVHVLKELPDSKDTFALKNSVLRSLLRRLPPKKAMKQLGYRSTDSFLKHEAPVSALAAAWLTEGSTWQQRFLDQYKQLGPTDFENRDLIIMQPDSRRWQALAHSTVARRRHNILAFKELGALVCLPLPASAPDGAVTASLSMALHELNQIRAAGTFLKLCQVRPDFGGLVRSVTHEEPEMGVKLLNQPLSWQLIQRYYARLTEQFRDELFGPHIRVEDMVWHPIEEALSAIEPSFAFWKDSAHLAILKGSRPVSLNIVDVALNCCNDLPLERRVVHYFQQSLWHELLLDFMHHDTVEQTVMAALQPTPRLAQETVPA